MLIRPKRIYNFCLFHAYIGVIAICFATLSYLLQHIWTNLLTQCPNASFCLLLSVHCRKMSNIKVLGKIQKNQIKNQQSGRLQKPEGPPEGTHPWPGASMTRPAGGRATWPPAPRGPPIRPPFGIYLALASKTLEESSVTRFHPLFRRRHDSNLGIAGRSCPGTLPEGGSTSYVFSTTMSCSGMCRE